MQSAKDRLIVALDVGSTEQAINLFETLRDIVGIFKIGSQLFTAAGPDIVRRIVQGGGRVFLDLKFHDIPNTVALAGAAAARLGVSIFNVHASGGAEMMKRTIDAVTETAARENLSPPKVIAVTILTSLERSALTQLGINDAPVKVVTRLARAASDCGLDGVVASPLEIKEIRATVADPSFIIVTPGIRSGADAKDDQRRTLGAAEAIRSGANYVVVGRPILNAADPRAAAESMIDEIARTI
jgi:orotidine-5'-phosphate decarboxylase